MLGYLKMSEEQYYEDYTAQELVYVYRKEL